jgi:hypothetical protein
MLIASALRPSPSRPASRRRGPRRTAAAPRRRPTRRSRHQVEPDRSRHRVRPCRRASDRRRDPAVDARTTRSSARRAPRSRRHVRARVARRPDRRHRQLRLRPPELVHLGRGRRRRRTAGRRGVRPGADELFSAARGGGATLNGDGDQLLRGEQLSEALVGTGFSYSAERRAAQATVSPPAARGPRHPALGSAAIDLCLVACGRLDAYFEEHLNSWDLAAGVLIAAEAGARSPPTSPAARPAGTVAAGSGISTPGCSS